MYSATRSFIWPPPEDGGSSSASKQTARKTPAQPAEGRQSHHAQPTPPGRYSRPADEQSGEQQQQQFGGAEIGIDLSAVRAFNSINSGASSARGGELVPARRRLIPPRAYVAPEPAAKKTTYSRRVAVESVLFDGDGNIVEGQEISHIGDVQTGDTHGRDDDDEEMDDSTMLSINAHSDQNPTSASANNGIANADDDEEPVADPGAPAATTAETQETNLMPAPPHGSLHVSRDALLRAANLHACKYGYALSIKKSSASGQKVIITCTREGRPMNSHQLTEETRVRKGRVSKRSGCRMKIAGNRIKVKRMVSDGRGGQRPATEAEGGPEAEVWRLRVIQAEHNHGPDDEKRMNPIHRKMTDEMKQVIALRVTQGLKVSQIWEDLAAMWPGLTANHQDVRNEVARIKKARADLDPEDTGVQREFDEGRINGHAIMGQRGLRRNGAGRLLSHAYPTEQERTAVAVMKAQMLRLEEDNKTLRERELERGREHERDTERENAESQALDRQAEIRAVEERAEQSRAAERRATESRVRTELRSENEKLKEEIARLKSELDIYKRDVDVARNEKKNAETRLDELRAMLDRYLLGGMGAPNSGMPISNARTTTPTPLQQQSPASQAASMTMQPQMQQLQQHYQQLPRTQQQQTTQPQVQQHQQVQQQYAGQHQQFGGQGAQFTSVNGSGAAYGAHYGQTVQQHNPHGHNLPKMGRIPTLTDWRT